MADLEGFLRGARPRPPATLTFYHGGPRKTLPVRVPPGLPLDYEWGPAFYLSTGWQTARRYAPGNGSVHRVTVDADLGWTAGAAVSLAEALDLAGGVRGLGRGARERVARDLRAEAAQRRAGDVAVESLVNLLVTERAFAGARAPAFAAELAARGFDARLVDARAPYGGEEDWVALFNPAKVRRIEVVPTRGFEGPWYLPRVAEQYAALRASGALPAR